MAADEPQHDLRQQARRRSAPRRVHRAEVVAPPGTLNLRERTGVIDHVNNLKLQHLVELSKLGDGCCAVEEAIEAWLDEHDVVFAGQTIPFVLMPHFVSPGQVRRVRHAVDSICAVLNRFCDAYPDEPALQAELALSDHEDALVRLEPGYPGPMRICHLDAFLQGYEVKFLEFNSDSPAGIGYTDVLYEGLCAGINLPRVDAEFDTAYTPMLPELVATLLDAYRQLRLSNQELPVLPRVAVVDIDGSPSVPEFRITCAAVGDAGLEAVHVTADQLEFDGTSLLALGQPVQLVYRRALLEDLSEGPLVDAIRAGAAAVVNPYRARVANNKKLFALLQDERWAHLVGREADVVRNTIPWTRVLRDERP